MNERERRKAREAMEKAIGQPPSADNPYEGGTRQMFRADFQAPPPPPILSEHDYSDLFPPTYDRRRQPRQQKRRISQYGGSYSYGGTWLQRLGEWSKQETNILPDGKLKGALTTGAAGVTLALIERFYGNEIVQHAPQVLRRIIDVFL